MSRLKEARTFAFDTLIVAVSQGLQKLRALITLPLVVKLLGTESYGIWSQTLTLTSVMGTLFLFNLHLPLVRRVAAEPANAGSTYSSILLVMGVIYAVLASTVVIFVQPLSALVMGKPGLERFILITLLFILVGNVRMLNTNLYRGTGRFWIRSVVDLVVTFGGLVVIIALLARGASLMKVLAALVAWETAATVATTIHCFKIAGIVSPKYAIVKAAFLYCLPLLSSGIAMTLLDRADRFFLSNSLGLRAVGVYSASYALANVMLLFQAPLQFTLFPKIASLWERDRALAGKYLGIAIHVFLAFAIPCAVGISILAPRLLRLLGNAETGSAGTATVLFICLGVLCWGVSLCESNIFYAAQNTGTFAKIILVGAGVNIAANAVLVPLTGLLGAALATFIAYGLTCVWMSLAGRRDFPLIWQPRFITKCAGAALAMGAVLLWWSPHSGRSLVAAATCAGTLYVVLLVASRAVTSEHLDKARAILRPRAAR